MDRLTVPVMIRPWRLDFINKLEFYPDVRNWTFLASSITSFLVLRNSVSEAHVVCLEIVEIMPFTISSSYNGEFEIDSVQGFVISGYVIDNELPVIIVLLPVSVPLDRFQNPSFNKIDAVDIVNKICLFLKKI